MTRIVKKHLERKNEILDTAEKLFYQQGYEKVSIANIIDTIGIAKGTFYHYFKSKEELLDQIIERQVLRIDQIIERVLEEPEENALVELNNLYASIGEYKAGNKEVFLLMTKALYSEGNIILLNKLTKSRIKTVAPKIARVISRGIDENIFHTGNPDYIAEMILYMSIYLSDEFARLALENKLNRENKKSLLEKCRTFEESVERILGAPNGSIIFCNKELIDVFFES